MLQTLQDVCSVLARREEWLGKERIADKLETLKVELGTRKRAVKMSPPVAGARSGYPAPDRIAGSRNEVCSQTSPADPLCRLRPRTEFEPVSGSGCSLRTTIHGTSSSRTVSDELVGAPDNPGRHGRHRRVAPAVGPAAAGACTGGPPCWRERLCKGGLAAHQAPAAQRCRRIVAGVAPGPLTLHQENVGLLLTSCARPAQRRTLLSASPIHSPNRLPQNR